MRSRSPFNLALWALVAGFLLVLCASPAVYTRHQRRDGSSNLKPHIPSRRAGQDIGRSLTSHSPMHQDPAKAPPQPLPEVMAGFSAKRSDSSFLTARSIHHQLGKRDALRCDDGPCIDGSCCSKDKICGYGPDYCGTGCISQCNATAMCGKYSENAAMPCGMQLCCSAMGWCGVSSDLL
jgi:chitinase